MLLESIWIEGFSRSGKTTRLVEQFCAWVEKGLKQPDRRVDNSSGQRVRTKQTAASRLSAKQTVAAALVFAANGDNRIELADRISTAIPNLPVQTTTPLAFFEDEVILFWPLLVRRLQLKAQFPLRLRPETEQELATQLWRPELDLGFARQMGVNEYRAVRRALDLLLLAGLSGTPIEDVSKIVEQGFPVEEEKEKGEEQMELFSSQETQSSITIPPQMLLRWREWCLERGLLTYGIIAELYWRYLLPDETYRHHLTRRCRLVLADDVDDYPAIARHLFDFLLNKGAIGVFTYNPEGGIRVGLGADPDYMTGLQSRCTTESLTRRPIYSLFDTWGTSVIEAVSDPMLMFSLPEPIKSIQTASRSQLLRQTGEVISEAINSGEVEPQEIAVIAPGLDAIARYSLIEILTSKGIPVESLSDQRPLSSSPIIRSLLTLLALVYPGLGRLVDRDAIAEMLVVLSQKSESKTEETEETTENPTISIPHTPFSTDIDPVRAGLIADYCFEPHPELPNLLPVDAFSRWDRLGYRATKAYEEIVQWLEEQRSQQQQHLIPSPVYILDRAIQRFLWNGSYLAFHQLAALRELMETAQHYWEVDARMRKSDPNDNPFVTTVGRFIQLLRGGTVTANPYPVRLFGAAAQAVTLANIFQYRASRRFHRWQFWLDASSHLWSKGGAATLFGSPLFLQHRFGKTWTAQDEIETEEERIRRIIKDLLSRAGERIYLCHSDLAVNGQDQTGPLLTLVNASVPIVTETAVV
ncbi:MAG TPA: recombinase family protein [Leptolyngbyaceae cyanobacterium]